MFRGPRSRSSWTSFIPKSFCVPRHLNSWDSDSFAPNSSKGICLVSNSTQHHSIPKKPHDPRSLTSQCRAASSEPGPERVWSPAGRSLVTRWQLCSLFFCFVSNLSKGLVPGEYFKEVLLNLSILRDRDDHSFIEQAFSEYLLRSRPWARTGNNTQREYDSCPARNGICSPVKKPVSEL